MGLKFVHLAEINISVNGKRGYLSKQGLEGHLGSRMRSRALELTRNSKRALAFPSFKLIFTISCKLFAIIKCLFSTLLYFCLMPVADTTTLKFIKQYPFNKLSFLGQIMYPNYFSNPAHSIPHKLSLILTMLDSDYAVPIFLLILYFTKSRQYKLKWWLFIVWQSIKAYNNN